MTSYDLDQIARVFRVHPRTILNYMCPDETWTVATRKKLFDIEDIVIAFGISEAHFARCERGRDELMTTKQVSELLDVPMVVIRQRAYPLCVTVKSMQRFLKSAVMRCHLDRYANKPYKARGPRKKKQGV